MLATAGFGASRPCIAYQGAAHTTTTSRVKIVEMSNSPDDTDHLFVAVFGDLA